MSADSGVSRSEAFAYWGLYLIILFFQCCGIFLFFSTDNCHGPGAQFPGGCPAFSHARDIAIMLLSIGGLIGYIGILVSFQYGFVQRKHRLVVVSVYSFLLLVLPYVISLLLPTKR
jgi:hypothetical protein